MSSQTNSPKKTDPRAAIPSVHVMADRLGTLFPNDIPHETAVRLARFCTQTLRQNPEQGLGEATILKLVGPLLQPGPQRVINGTGILLHTNLGRSPLDKAAIDRAVERVSGYTDLEFNLADGKRGHRDRHFADLARLLFDVEDATLVNNAAAAVSLSLSALAANGETIISRGELIEIGGSFRLPDIMSMAGTRLVEVGATNKTRIGDYRAALGADTACLMKTHTSNYRMVGFTQETPLSEIVALGREHQVPVIMDLGSGLSRSMPFPAVSEPFIEDYLKQDPDLLIFSGDKLLGGIQAGIIMGKAACIRKLRKHPMMRMLRQDKLSIAITCEIMADIARGVQNPFSQIACTDLKDLELRNQRVIAACPGLKPVSRDDQIFVGGGSLPGEARPSRGLVLDVESPSRFAAALRRVDPPVIGYVREDRFRLNLTTVPSEMDDCLIELLNSV